MIPLTTKLLDDAEPLRLTIKASASLKKESDLMIDQIRAIDNKKLVKEPLSQCTSTFMDRVYSAVSEVMGF